MKNHHTVCLCSLVEEDALGQREMWWLCLCGWAQFGTIWPQQTIRSDQKQKVFFLEIETCMGLLFIVCALIYLF